MESVRLMNMTRLSMMLCAALGLAWTAGFAADTQDLNDAIRKERMGTVVIQVPPGTPVHVRQLRHDFWFGAALPDGFFGSRSNTPDAMRFKKVFLENFNSAVTENALKWHNMERKQGQVNYATLEAMLQWTKENDIPLRGHNIYWGVPDRVQEWLKAMDTNTLRETLQARAVDVAKRYEGRFAEYDLNNEMLHGNYYEKRLGTGITREMVEWIRKEDPKAVLFLNDYDILTGRRVDDYVAQISGFRSQGIPLGGIGAQGHLRGDSFDPAALKAALDKLGQFKLPIRITEFNFPGQRSKYYNKRDVVLSDEEEQIKARAIVDYYRICFAHPAVEGILMWGFWEGANWIPVSSLFRKDWSPTPAAAAYHDLIYKEWWTDWQGKADAQGRCEVRVFYGKHQVQAGDKSQVITFKRGETSPSVLLK